MTKEQIIKEINKAMELGRKEAYSDIYCIVSNMSATDNNENLNELLIILYGKVYADAGSEE